MGLKTKSGTGLIEDIPVEWIFEYYLNTEKLHGQEVKMNSIFNHEKTPSMTLYVCSKTNQYKFKDFSSGKAGNAIDIVMYLHNLSYTNACNKIYNDYHKTNTHYVRTEVAPAAKAKLINYELRGWTVLDKEFWTTFKIGSDLLEEYNVKPLLSVTYQKGDETFKIEGGLRYGYFKKDGSIYKIYTPKVEKMKKFFSLSKYTQGYDQLTFSVPYLVICSSLKDVMAFRLMKFNNAEAIAPASENTMISADELAFYKSKYKKICVLFDNDAAGIKSMEKYREEHGFEMIVLKMEKDLSDSVRDHGINNVRVVLYPLITKALTGKAKYI